MALIEVADLLEHLETGLPSDPLQRILDAADAEIEFLVGPLDTVAAVDETDQAFNARIKRETDRRIGVLIEVCRLAVEYDGTRRSTSGNVTDEKVAYTEERARLIAQLYPPVQVG